MVPSMFEPHEGAIVTLRWPVLVLRVAVGLCTTVAAMVVVAPSAVVAHPANLAEFYGQQVTWASCGESYDPALQCAMIMVPLDYRRPGAERISIAVSRLSAATPE